MIIFPGEAESTGSSSQVLHMFQNRTSWLSVDGWQ